MGVKRLTVEALKRLLGFGWQLHSPSSGWPIEVMWTRI